MDFGIFELLAELFFEKVSELQQLFNDFIWEYWDERVTTYNPGQDDIYAYHLGPSIWEFVDFANETWPWVDTGDYVLGCYWSYDQDVMDRAFSDSIEGPVEHMEEIIEKAQEDQMMGEMFQEMADFFAF